MEQLKERQKQSYQNMFYSLQRIDLLIISLSGAGIYVCLETVKYLIDKEQDVSLLIKFSGGFFIVSIIVNFVSQWFGFKTNEKDYLMCEAEINAGEKINKKEQEVIDAYDTSSEKYTKWTNRMNVISMACMFIGLILTSIFFFITF
jgi:hypothetical protein